MPYLTNETLFALDVLPEHLIVLGGGRDRDARWRRRSAGWAAGDGDRARSRRSRARTATRPRSCWRGYAARASRSSTGTARRMSPRGGIAGGDACGRAGHRQPPARRDRARANVAELELEAAGVEAGEDGIAVDARRRTTNRRIYAIGDCRAGPRFTHVAGYEGSLVALDIALGWPGKVDWRALPRVTYTDPELAQIGLTEAEARERYGSVEVTRQDFAHNDRAVTEGDTRGFPEADPASRARGRRHDRRRARGRTAAALGADHHRQGFHVRARLGDRSPIRRARRSRRRRRSLHWSRRCSAHGPSAGRDGGAGAIMAS